MTQLTGQALQALIGEVEAGIAALPSGEGGYEALKARLAAAETLAGELAGHYGGRIGFAGDAKKLTLGGISTSSTAGWCAVLTRWLDKARAALAAEEGAGA